MCGKAWWGGGDDPPITHGVSDIPSQPWGQTSDKVIVCRGGKVFRSQINWNDPKLSEKLGEKSQPKLCYCFKRTMNGQCPRSWQGGAKASPPRGGWGRRSTSRGAAPPGPARHQKRWPGGFPRRPSVGPRALPPSAPKTQTQKPNPRPQTWAGRARGRGRGRATGGGPPLGSGS